MKKIFIVDDNRANLFSAQKALSENYNVYTLRSASAMFELLEDVIPDLLLLDIKMPKMDGFEAMRLLKEDERYMDIPIIFLTGQIDAETEVQGFKMGAIDFIPKPFSGPVLANRIKTHLEIEGLIRDQTEMLLRRAEKLQRLQNSMVSVLANMVENRDKFTGRHIERTSRYIKLLLDAMLERKVYFHELKTWDTDVVISSSRLHDIGKIVISDLILNKPGSLTQEEFEIIKTHTTQGENIINSIIAESGDEEFLLNAKLLAGSHHERWDGKGYPRGLKGEAIPLQGRIMAIADVYDALVSERPYKKAFTHEEAVKIIMDSKGSHFDPVIADVFLEIHESFKPVQEGASL